LIGREPAADPKTEVGVDCSWFSTNQNLCNRTVFIMLLGVDPTQRTSAGSANGLSHSATVR